MDLSKMGIITVASGNIRYYRQAELLAISVKTNMPALPVAIVTDRLDVDHRWFDQVIRINPDWGGGVQQKLFLDRYSPFVETLFVDSDCIVTRDFKNELAGIRQLSFTPVCEQYLSPMEVDPFIVDLRKALALCGGTRFPKFNGGVYFFKQDAASAQVFDRARQILADYKSYGVKDFNQQGPGEETIFALALAGLKMENLYDDRGKLMRPTINVGKPFMIQPVHGGCRFKFYDQIVEPAICHFVRNNVMDYHYRKAEYLLRNHNQAWRSYSDKLLFASQSIFSVGLYNLKMFRFRLLRWLKGNPTNPSAT